MGLRSKRSMSPMFIRRTRKMSRWSSRRARLVSTGIAPREGTDDRRQRRKDERLPGTRTELDGIATPQWYQRYSRGRNGESHITCRGHR